MISFSTPKTLDTGATISLAVVTQVNLNPLTLRLSGTVAAFFDSTHQAANKPMRTYPVNLTLTSDQITGNLVLMLENAAIAKYPDLQNGTQS